jgi:ABC-type multidrug transport system fused ATPase/permease subunit
LRFAYDDGPLLLDDVSFDVAPGEALGVVGVSDCGKSTLLHLLAGDLEPLAGTIAVDGPTRWLLPGVSRSAKWTLSGWVPGRIG